MDSVVFFLFHGFVLAAGVLLAALERRLIGRKIIGGLLIAGIAGGLLTTRLSPFNFGDGGYYMQGVIVATASAEALAGYALATLLSWLRRRTSAQQQQ